MRLRFWILLIIFSSLVHQGIACRFTIRDIGYSPLNLESYVLHMEADTIRYRQVIRKFMQLGKAYAANANIHYRITHTPGQIPVIKFMNSRGQLIEKQGVKTQKEVYSFYDEILFSPLQQTMSHQIGNVFAYMVCFYNKDNKKVNAQVEKALKQFRKVAPTLDKKVSEGIMKILIPGKDRAKEKIILKSMGLSPSDHKPVVMIIYGRGRLVGDPLVGEKITAERLQKQLVLLGTDCECGIDLSPLLKRAVPFNWDDDMRQDVTDMLGFDVDNPMVTTEMDRILSKEPLETGTADPTFAPQVINLDQKLKATPRQQEEPVVVTGMHKTLRYSLLAGAFLLLLIVTGVFIVLRRKN